MIVIQHAFGESDLVWTLDKNEKAYTSYPDAIVRFYRDFEEGCFDPLLSLLNPEKDGVLYFPFSMVRLFFYRRDYRICIVKHHSTMSGPHAARLQLKGAEGLHWLASCQIEGNFYHETTILEQVKLAIVQKRFYVSPKSATDKLIL